MKTNNLNSTKEHAYFVSQLYRDFLLPTILGEDNASILYWAGKQIAHHYALASFNDVASLFKMAEFGTLKKVKERRTSTVFELSGQTVSDRIDSANTEFSLESGILAETMQSQTGHITECELKINKKEKIVQISANFE